MCIETINKNRVELGFKELTGAKNIEELELLCPDYTCVLTFNQWNSKGRVVIKGEKSFRLKGAREVKNKKTGEKETKFYQFCVFDVSQTREMTEDEIEAYKEKQAKKQKKE